MTYTDMYQELQCALRRITELEQWQKVAGEASLRWGIRVARMERAQGGGGQEQVTAPTGRDANFERIICEHASHWRNSYLRASATVEAQAATIARLEKSIANHKECVRLHDMNREKLHATIFAHEATIARLQEQSGEDAKRIADLRKYAKVVEGERNEAAQKASQASTLIRRCTTCRHALDFPCGWVTVEGWAGCGNWLAPEVKPEPERTCGNCYSKGGNAHCPYPMQQRIETGCLAWWPVPETPQRPAVAPPEAADGDKGERTCANCITESYCTLYGRAVGKGCRFWGAGTTSREDAPESAPVPEVVESPASTPGVPPTPRRDARGRFVAHRCFTCAKRKEGCAFPPLDDDGATRAYCVNWEAKPCE